MCGIIGIVANINCNVNQMLFDGMTVLQHRGQDAAGMVTCDGDRLYLRKNNGSVRDVFRTRHMKNLVGHMGIGHVRYPTAGTSSSAEAQPLYVNSPYGITVAHNGNLTNADELTQRLYKEDLRHLNTTSDSEILLNIFAHELSKGKPMHIEKNLYLDVEDIFAAVSGVHSKCEGSYSVISMIVGYGVLAYRDPHGIRPLVIGSKDGPDGKEWIFASESVAIVSLGYNVLRDVEPGEAIFIDAEGKFYSKQCAEETELSPCIFEYVYFARPDSTLNGISVHQTRINMGEALANKIMNEDPEHDIDVVIPIPDSGRISALQVASTMGIEYREGFVKNRYIGRTFIMPGQQIRKKSVRKKLNAIRHEFEGKNVLLVDDSIVRGNTSKQIIQMAREVGANKVYFASAAPPVAHPNVYGIDMPAVNELIANSRNNDEICEFIGADKLYYQNLDDLIECCSIGENPPRRFDCSCFNAEYICGNITSEYLDSLQKKRNDAAKNSTFKVAEVIEMHNEE